MAIADTNEHVKCATSALAPAPNDNADVAFAGLWRGIRGNGAAAVTVNLILSDDSAAVSFLLQPGEVCPVSVKRVKLTGTTAAQGEFILLR